MPSLRKSTLHAVCLILISITAAAGSPRIPARIESLKPGFKFPIWVSAAEVFDASGAVRPNTISPLIVDSWNSFDEARQKTLAERGAKHPRIQSDRAATDAEKLAIDCGAGEVLAGGRGHALPYATLQDRVSSAKAIIVGTVREEEPGFYGGAAGTLMRVEVAQVLKSGGSLDANGDILAFVDVGHFRAGGRSFCSGRAEYALPPLGSRVVIFSFDEPFDAAHKLIELDFGHDLAAATDEGKFAGPHPPEAPDLRSLLSMIRELTPRAAQRVQ